MIDTFIADLRFNVRANTGSVLRKQPHDVHVLCRSTHTFTKTQLDGNIIYSPQNNRETLAVVVGQITWRSPDMARIHTSLVYVACSRNMSYETINTSFELKIKDR